MTQNQKTSHCPAGAVIEARCPQSVGSNRLGSHLITKWTELKKRECTRRPQQKLLNRTVTLERDCRLKDQWILVMLEQTPQRSETPPPIDTWDRHAVMRKVASLPKETVLTNCLERLGSGTLETSRALDSEG